MDFTPWGAQSADITLNFQDTTQYGSPNSVVFQNQNGYSSGNLIAIKVGKNLFLESYSSGSPTLGAPGTVGVGSIYANSLKSSNVDLAEEFIRMIAAQRAYQVNVRVITTTDNMLNELMNIVR